MAKTAIISELGDANQFSIVEQDIPPPGPGEVQIRNRAIGLNFIDIYQRRGLYPVSLPAVLGKEAAGEVIAIGQGVTGITEGQRVASLVQGGGYAQIMNAPASRTAILPESVSFDIAAGALLKGLTASMLIHDIFPLAAGHTVLVTAASGGVGGILCQWALHLGANIIAVVGSAEKADIARQNSIKNVIIRTQTNDLAGSVRDLTNGDGVDVVYDSLGAETFYASLDSLRPRGLMVTYGNATGPVPAIAPLELAKRGSLILTRPILFDFATPDRFASMAEKLFTVLANGVVKPSIHKEYQLDSVSEAHQFLESGKSQGTIILHP